MRTPVSISEEKFGSVSRCYIECLDDQAILIEMQRKMVEATPCGQVLQIDTSHSPFFIPTGGAGPATYDGGLKEGALSKTIARHLLSTTYVGEPMTLSSFRITAFAITLTGIPAFSSAHHIRGRFF